MNRLTVKQKMVLDAIPKVGHISCGMVAEKLNTPSTKLQPVLDALEKKGIIDTIWNPGARGYRNMILSRKDK